MKKQKRTALLLCLLLVCLLFLTGCSAKNETLDAQLEQVLDVLDRGDEEAFVALFYPGIAPDSELHGFYAQFREVWTPLDREQIKLVSYNVQSSSNLNVHSSSGRKVFQGVYQLPREDELSLLEIIYVENEEGRGLTGLRMGQPAEGASGSPDVWQSVNLVLCAVVIILTIIDVIRKKPVKFGWYIVIALIWFNFRFNSFSLTLPLGSIIYWCLRKRLLREKELLTNAAVPYSPPEAEPPAPDPAEDAEREETEREE